MKFRFPLKDYVAYLNGVFLPYAECKVHVSDRGFRLGDGVYDTERTFNGKVFRLQNHLKRFFRSMASVDIDSGLSMKEFEDLTLELLKRNEPLRKKVGDFTITQFATRGESFRASEKVDPTVGIRVAPVNFGLFADFYKSGCNVVFPRNRSYSLDTIDPRIKHTSRMNFVLAEIQATRNDPRAYPVLLDSVGNITENIAGNVFLVSGGELLTPYEGSMLEGVTRTAIIELARGLKIPVQEGLLRPYDAYAANEAFLTATSYSILPVSQFDHKHVSEVVPGPITRKLLAAWNKLVGLDIVKQASVFAKSRRT